MNITASHKEVYTVTKKMNIKYNSYTYDFEIDEAMFGKGGEQSKTVFEHNNKRNRIEIWFEDFLNKYGEDFNRPDLEIQFASTAHEIKVVKEIVASVSKTKDWNILFLSSPITDKDVLGELYNLIEKIEKNGDKALIDKLKEKGVLAKKEENKKKEVSVVVIAPMSAGKSTLINALLGKDLLPSRNEACTATICKIKDVDGKKHFDAIIKDGKGNVLEKKGSIDSSFLENYNAKGNKEELEILLEGDIQNISSRDISMVLVDTPGPNNSQSIRHKEITYGYIKDQINNPLILYVLTPSQLQTNDNQDVLHEIRDEIKRQGKKSEDRIVFVLNRIDDLKKNDGSVSDVIEKCQNYLKENLGILMPKIFPVSAEFAKLSILNEINAIDEDEEEDFLDLLTKKLVKRGTIDLIQYAPISASDKRRLYEEVENDEYKACLHYSGLTALQIYINEYVNTTSKIVFSHELIEILEPALSEVIKEHNIKYNTSLGDVEKLKNELEKITPYFTTQFVKKKEEIEKRINAVCEKSSVIETLLMKVDKERVSIINDFNNFKANRREAEKSINRANAILSNLEISLKTTIKSEQDYIVKNVKGEIELLLRNGFMELISNANLSSFNNDMLQNSIKFSVNNSSASMISSASRVVGEIVGTKKISTSSWWNPFSWGDYRTENIIENKEYVNLNSIFNSNYTPVFTQLSNRIHSINKDFEDTLTAIKKDGIDRIDEIKNRLDNYKSELIENTKRVELSEKERDIKGTVLKELVAFENTFKIIKK